MTTYTSEQGLLIVAASVVLLFILLQPSTARTTVKIHDPRLQKRVHHRGLAQKDEDQIVDRIGMNHVAIYNDNKPGNIPITDKLLNYLSSL